ncbi:MAG: glycosyltransferase family 2 protein [bacterium]|nr:glycosyltransferase family 2 protein [bacterium]
MSKIKDISVVVPAYNEEKYILNSLRSLINQNLVNTISYEIIVVDNASTDNTYKIVKDFIDKYKKSNDNITFELIKEDRKGVAFARQTGFSAANSKVIATLDADCIASPLWIRTIFNIFNYDYDYLYNPFFKNLPSKIMDNLKATINKEIVAATGMIKFYDADTPELKFINNLIPLFLNIGNFFYLFPSLHGSNLAVLKKAFLQVNGFNLNLKTGEDLDLGLKLEKIGRIVYLPAIVYASSRRFKKNIIKAILIYTVANFLFHRITGKPLINELDTPRGEKENILQKLNLENLNSLIKENFFKDINLIENNLFENFFNNLFFINKNNNGKIKFNIREKVEEFFEKLKIKK